MLQRFVKLGSERMSVAKCDDEDLWTRLEDLTGYSRQLVE